jgi:hypothetical protein
MANNNNWIVQLCDYHAIQFEADYVVCRIIKEALQQKGSCQMCKLDIPENIKRVDILLYEEQLTWPS